MSKIVTKLDTGATLKKCPDGLKHHLIYQGRKAQGYTCERCDTYLAKEDLANA